MCLPVSCASLLLALTPVCGRQAGSAVKRTINSAYPRVISNLGALSDDPVGLVAINMIRFMNHYARSIREKQQIVSFFFKDQPTKARIRSTPGGSMDDLGDVFVAFKPTAAGTMGTKEHIGIMYDYFGVGFANTLGYAHPNTGDTMVSVMIGGLRTVQNGDFEVFAGDLIQFYWAFEKDDFLPDGRRKPYLDIWDGDTPQNVDPRTTHDAATGKRDAAGWERQPDAQLRNSYFNLQYGQRPGKEKLVAKIKPYFQDEENPRLFDWYRVFAVAIASARPNEACDIKISRQSM